MGYTRSMGALRETKQRETKQADERGRISLGMEFAHCTFLVESDGDAMILRPARVIPEREAWLYQNEVALSRVRRGLGQAQRREFAKPPSLRDARRVAGESDVSGA